MKNLLIVLTLLCVSQFSFSQEFVQDWRIEASSTNNYMFTVTDCIDDEGSVYYSIDFKTNITIFDTTITASGADVNSLIVKVNKHGKKEFIKHLRGTALTQTYLLIYKDGYVYAVFTTTSNPVFIDTTELATISGREVGVYKFNKKGEISYVKLVFYSTNDQNIASVIINSKNEFVLFLFYNTSGVLRGGTLVESIDGTALQPIILVLDTASEYISHKALRALSTAVVVHGNFSNVVELPDSSYIGTFSHASSIIIDSDTIVGNGFYSLSLVKLNSDYSLQWYRKFISSGNYNFTRGFLVSDNYAYISTLISAASLQVDSTEFSLSQTFYNVAPGTGDAFFAKYTIDGTLVTAKIFGAAGLDGLTNGMALKGHLLYIPYQYTNNQLLDTFSITTTGGKDNVLFTMDKNLDVKKLLTFRGGLLTESMRGSSFDNQGNLFFDIYSNSNPLIEEGVNYPLVGAKRVTLYKYRPVYKALSAGNKVLKFNNQIINFN